MYEMNFRNDFNRDQALREEIMNNKFFLQNGLSSNFSNERERLLNQLFGRRNHI